MKKIVVVGSLNMDLITQTDKLPQVGETVSGSSFDIACGGKGGNQAYAVARLGGHAVMLGCIGQDSFGPKLVYNLQGVGVDCNYIQICKEADTGTASITVSGGNNSIIIIPGANANVTIARVKQYLEDIHDTSLIIMQLEIPIETVEYVISYAYKRGIPVILNPSPVKKIRDDLFGKIQYLIVNETECEFYSGIPIHTVEEAKEGLKNLIKQGIQQVIVTLGEQGAIFNCGTEILHKKAEKVTALDSTAAGDTFAAAVAVALSEGKNMKEAIDIAIVASSIVVTRLGAQTSIPARKEVNIKLEANQGQRLL